MSNKKYKFSDSLDSLGRRRLREYLAIKAMIEIYCRDHHQHESMLCSECQSLEAYVRRRYTRCVFEEGKGICTKCRIQCYRRNYRDRVDEVIRYGEIRLWRKNIRLAWYYLWDRLKPAPTMQDTFNYHRRQHK
jgi:Nitrous oxide-stimulated promoter.